MILLLLAFVALTAMVVTHVVLQRRLAAECRAVLEREETRRRTLDELDSARNTLLYKQQKESARVVARSDRAVRKLTGEVNTLRGDAEAIHRQIETFFADARVQRYLGQIEGVGQHG